MNALMQKVRGALGDAQSTPSALSLDPVIPGNIDLNRRPVVRNPDGSISTVRSMSINVDGREYLIPTVSEDGRVLDDEDAIDLFMNTGRHLGAFDTPEQATRYAERLHQQQEKQYGVLR